MKLRNLKKYVSLMLIFTIIFSITVQAFATEQVIKISVDGAELLQTEGYGEVYVDSKNRTMVPLRMISEGLNFKVGWDEKTDTAIINNGAITVTIGELVIRANGKYIQMDTKSVEKNGRIYVPARHLAQALGCVVEWKPNLNNDGIDWVVITTTKDTPAGDITVIKPSDYPFSGFVAVEADTGGSGVSEEGWSVSSVLNPRGGSYQANQSFAQVLEQLNKTWTSANGGGFGFDDGGNFGDRSLGSSVSLFQLYVNEDNHPTIEFFTFSEDEFSQKNNSLYAELGSGIVSAVSYFYGKEVGETTWELLTNAFWDKSSAEYKWFSSAELAKGAKIISINGNKISVTDPKHFGLLLELSDITIK